MNLYARVLLYQAFSVLFAIFIFQFLVSRNIAGLIAGMVFLAASASSLQLLFTLPNKWRSPSFWIGWFQLIVVILPMIGLRVFQFDVPFDQIMYYGKLTGPQFHALSEKIYGSWILVTFLEGAYSFIKKRRPKT